MKPRQGIAEIFSTFLQIAEKDGSWITDPKLLRSIQSHLAQQPEANSSEDFWVIYWHKIWHRERNGLAGAHLSAYLQEPCYWAAQKMTCFAPEKYELSDYFQIAIAEFNRVLESYNPNQGSKLKNYATPMLRSIIRDKLRQRGEIDICTDLGLLRKISQKILVESLDQAGLELTTREQYRLAWSCFKALYVPERGKKTSKLPKLDQATGQKIAQLYNQERQTLQSPGRESTPEIIKEWLRNCANYVRSYLYPQNISLNTPQPGQDTGEWQDNLPAIDEPLLNELIGQEEIQDRSNQQNQLNEVLIAAIGELDDQIQTMLQLYYCQKLSQSQIAKQLEMQQYKVSRRLTKARTSLLKSLAKWSKEKLHISLNTNLIKDMSKNLEEWLQCYYQKS